MKRWLKASVVICILAGSLLLLSCQQTGMQTGLLQGGVTIGPLTPVEQPGVNPPVPPDVFSSRKVMVYDESGKNLVQEVSIRQIGQTAQGYYCVQLPAGEYTVDNLTGIGGSSNVPQKIILKGGGTVIIDLNIDTGIR
jgi:hypothetical protein